MSLDLQELYDELNELVERDDDPDDTLDDEDRERYLALTELDIDLQLADARGEHAIEDADFEDYARELAEEVGAIPDSHTWPTSYIDWSAAADALRMDYTSFTFDGTDYLVRL